MTLAEASLGLSPYALLIKMVVFCMDNATFRVVFSCEATIQIPSYPSTSFHFACSV